MYCFNYIVIPTLAASLRLDEILLHGGTADNYVHDDFWYFNITIMTWMKKDTFVYPVYPEDCTDDGVVETSDGWIMEGRDDCVSTTWPADLDRDPSEPYDIISYGDMAFYWPDPEYGPYDLPGTLRDIGYPVQPEGRQNKLIS